MADSGSSPKRATPSTVHRVWNLGNERLAAMEKNKVEIRTELAGTWVYPHITTINDEKDLFLHGYATDHIWCMEDVEGHIGIRLDCGDSGVVYLTHKQAKDLAEQLADFTAECQHEWEAKINSQFHSEDRTDVRCTKCQMAGERNESDGTVFYPAT